MKLIRKIADEISEELHSANKYATCAIKYKQEYPKLSQAYFDMAQDEITHAQTLHSNVVALIEEVRKKETPPEFMLQLWDEEHKKLIDKMAKVKTKLSLYR